jgi:hypothetical protein
MVLMLLLKLVCVRSRRNLAKVLYRSLGCICKFFEYKDRLMSSFCFKLGQNIFFVVYR